MWPSKKHWSILHLTFKKEGRKEENACSWSGLAKIGKQKQWSSNSFSRGSEWITAQLCESSGRWVFHLLTQPLPPNAEVQKTILLRSRAKCSPFQDENRLVVSAKRCVLDDARVGTGILILIPDFFQCNKQVGHMQAHELVLTEATQSVSAGQISGKAMRDYIHVSIT